MSSELAFRRGVETPGLVICDACTSGKLFRSPASSSFRLLSEPLSSKPALDRRCDHVWREVLASQRS